MSTAGRGTSREGPVRTIHQNPVGDGIRHRNREDCPCRPDVEQLLGDSGKWETLVVHHPVTVVRLDLDGPGSLDTVLDWVTDGAVAAVLYDDGELTVRIHAEGRLIVAHAGEYLGRGLGGDPSVVRPIPGDLVVEEEL